MMPYDEGWFYMSRALAYQWGQGTPAGQWLMEGAAALWHLPPGGGVEGSTRASLHANLRCAVGKRAILRSCAHNSSCIIRVMHQCAINVAKQDQATQSHVDQWRSD